MESVTPGTESVTGSESVMTSASIESDRPGSPESLKVAVRRMKFREDTLTDVEEDVAFENELQDDTDSEDDDKEKKEVKTFSDSAVAIENTKSQENYEVLETMTDQVLKDIPDEEAETSHEIKMNVNEEDKTKAAKKRSRKLKKMSEKRTAFDGRKVVFVTEFTQTDWNWKDKAEKTGKSTLSASFDNVSRTSSRSATVKSAHDSIQSLGQTQIDGESRQEMRTVTDLTPFYLVPDDEFGVPVVELSSDSENSDEEPYQGPKSYKHHLPSVGPPLILRYIRESDTIEKKAERSGENMGNDHNQRNFKETAIDEKEQVSLVGMFGGVCEFCGTDIKPFPSLDQQLSQPPESLYCCEEYREFVEFATTVAARLEEDVTKKSQEISVKVHAHHGSLQERQMAKERAALRMHEREIQRRQQEARGLQTAYNQYSQVFQKDIRNSDDAEDEIITVQKQVEDEERLPEVLRKKDRKIILSGKDEEMLVEGQTEVDGIKGVKGREQRGKRRKGGFGIGAKGGVFGGNHGERKSHYGKKGGQTGLTGGEQFTHHFSLRMPQGLGASHSSHGPLNIQVGRQMKTINYQLSSKRCLEEGWTLRAPSPMDDDDVESEIFVPEQLTPGLIAAGKLQERPMIEKFYPNGSKFLTIFPDGSGNVFYPSGRISILIVSIVLGQNTYIVQDDCDDAGLLAVFEPHGYGCCYFANGKIRLTYDQLGGLELDYAGGRKRTWNWKDHETHVHAPPFQPIVFGMNSYLGIRFMAQENIALTLTGRKRSCRFNVGAKLKIVSPDNIQPKGMDEDQLVMDEHKVKVQIILDKVSNLLKFPKSPKLDHILPSISVSVRQQKVEKMKQALLPLHPGQRVPKSVKQIRLPPLDSSIMFS